MALSHENALTITQLQSDQCENWDTYVEKHEDGAFFHLTGWKTVIEKTFGHPCFYLAAWCEQQLVGVLPLVQVKSLLFGNSLVSTPFCVYGGALADTDAIRLQLENKALDLGKELKVDFVELRDRKPLDNPNYEIFCHHSTYGCELADTPDAILAGVKKKQRAVIRHSLKNELQSVVNKDVGTAYDVYAESVRNLGTPVFHKQFFHNLAEVFGDKLDVLTVLTSEGTPVSSVLSFYYKDEVLPYYGGGLHDARALKSNDFMYYQLMCHARELGCTRYDFGRSKDDSGAAKYKLSYGMPAEPLHYKRALVEATEQPNLSPNNPKYALFINTWKKLPLWLSRLVGPYLSKYLG
ncbi:FemAB family XrtA/PEP-CTERM system-associated protein [Alteromonas lipolytica]|uniref:Peptidoglycan bridge formation protein FemAB n=1 Tax=Alteromonas lipolytica TaxID=1856405 RepID=A0A1E8FDQ0_9ALTE|nr:FemAB family XrtA/PEP-CTERM system-associated protein [Alteromonas lipolytica]OFI34050.1 peptidoglycan bridge formation protein FemAB [Alteromonas lipolytica]GGF65872.1 peptidoglycan bridge formation protein FemAB [Alteromonas lipolytica]